MGRPGAWPTSLLIAGFVCCFVLLFQQGNVVTSDGESMEAVAHSIVVNHSLSVPPDVGVSGRNGASFSMYGIGMSLLAVPAVVVGRLAGQIVGHADAGERFAVASLAPFILAGLAAAVYALARRLGSPERPAIIVGVGAALGTFLLQYGKDFFAEPLAALALVFAVERLLARRGLAASALLGVAILARPQAALPAILTIAVLVLHRRPRLALQASLGVLLALLFTAAYNAYRFGSPTNTGYGSEGSFTWSPDGWFGLFVDPAKSVILFAPAVVLVPFGLRRLLRSRNTLAAHLIVVNSLAIFVTAAAWHSWQGGWSWGPRLLILAVMLLLPVAALVEQRHALRWLLGLFGLGFAVSASVLVVPAQAQQLDSPPPSSGPSIIRQYELVPQTAAHTLNHPFGAGTETLGSHREYLALWQVEMTRQLGRKGLLVDVALSAALLGALVVMGRALVRRLVDEQRRTAAPGTVVAVGRRSSVSPARVS